MRLQPALTQGLLRCVLAFRRWRRSFPHRNSTLQGFSGDHGWLTFTIRNLREQIPLQDLKLQSTATGLWGSPYSLSLAGFSVSTYYVMGGAWWCWARILKVLIAWGAIMRVLWWRLRVRVSTWDFAQFPLEVWWWLWKYDSQNSYCWQHNWLMAPAAGLCNPAPHSERGLLPTGCSQAMTESGLDASAGQFLTLRMGNFHSKTPPWMYQGFLVTAPQSKTFPTQSSFLPSPLHKDQTFIPASSGLYLISPISGTSNATVVCASWRTWIHAVLNPPTITLCLVLLCPQGWEAHCF